MDQDFNDNLKYDFIVDSDSDIEGDDDDDYFSDNELVGEEMEEVPDEVFDFHLFEEKGGLTLAHPHPVDKSDLMSSQISTVTKSNLKSPYFPLLTTNLKSPESPGIIIEKTTAKPYPYQLLSIANGWIHKQEHTKRSSNTKDTLVGVLQCDKCAGCHRYYCSPTILIGNDAYNDNLVHTTDWFSDGFIYEFASIVAHDAHTSVMPYMMVLMYYWLTATHQLKS